MGKRSKWRKRQEKEKEQKETVKTEGSLIGYSSIMKENELFEKYYKIQGIVPEEEWSSFMSCVRESLPATFRITGYKRQAKALLRIIQGQYFKNLLNVEIEGEIIKQPFCLPWYPDNLAWQLTLSRVIIRKSEELGKLHNFLVSETSSGNISRQETVSMIPPLLLDVQPHHKVLDMCAAPGSKTSQIIEMLHKNEGKMPEGVVVANDVDNKRCYLLVHQAKRLHSPCFIVTNHDAANLPNFRVKKGDGFVNMEFDRILCDVPCSGDGTIRKNVEIWKKWNVGQGNNLHGLQVRIVLRGLELLSQGGKLVYSTCTLNPVEDEAVIKTILHKSNGTVELLEVSHMLPGLKSTRGVSKWKVVDRNMEAYETFDDVPEKFRTQIRPQMFPPTPDEASKFHLERCLRILPHHQDTGGFFVAVLQKNSSWEKLDLKEDEIVSKDDSDEEGIENKTERKRDSRSPPKKKPKMTGFKEDPYFFIDAKDETISDIRKFYEIEDSFPTTQLLTRCQNGRKRNIYIISDAGKQILEGNEDRIKIINTGVKIFSRCDNKDVNCSYRLCQEGLPTLLPFLSNRKVYVSREDLINLLSDEYPPLEKFTNYVQEQVKTNGSGCTVLVYVANKGLEEELEIILCGWQGKASLRCFVAKTDRIHYLRLAGVDVTNMETREKKFRQEGKKVLLKTEELDAQDVQEDGLKDD